MREIDIIVKDVLTSYGFIFKNTSWYRTTEDFIQIINFQKSLFSNKYYLNLGFDDRQVRPTYKPEYQFSVRLRIDILFSDIQLMQPLDFENDYPETTRRDQLHALVLRGIDFLDSVNGWNKLRIAISNQSHPIHHAFITAQFMKKITENITLT